GDLGRPAADRRAVVPSGAGGSRPRGHRGAGPLRWWRRGHRGHGRDLHRSGRSLPATVRGLVGTDPSLAPAPSGDDGTGAEGLPYPAWSMDWLTPEEQSELMAADCTDPTAQQDEVSAAAPDEPVVACDTAGSQKFLLGPEVVAGAAIQDASVASDVTPTGQPTGYFVVNMSCHDEAAQSFSDMTSALYGGEGATPAFGIVL